MPKYAEIHAVLAKCGVSADPGYTAVQTIPGIGPTLAAVFVAEIGDVHRFTGPDKLACWCGLTPKHHESYAHVHRGAITKQGSRLVRWAAVESVQRLSATHAVGAFRDRIAAKRGRNIAVVAAARKQVGHVYYAMRDHQVRALDRRSESGCGVSRTGSRSARIVQVMTPAPARSRL